MRPAEAGAMKAERAHARINRRVNCELEVDGRPHVGIAVHLSPGGFFVQTAAAVDVGRTVCIRLHEPGGGSIELQAKVANRRRVERRLKAVTRGGVGCAVQTAPETYYRLLGSLSQH